MFLGIDIGSSSSKVAILDGDKKLIAKAVVNKGTGTSGVYEALEMAFNDADITQEDVLYTIVTGYGRITYNNANKQITEISCHARGATYLMDDVVTIIDIGGQDAKVIRLNKNGTVANFVMNEKCAAGTGRFLEVMARVLGCQIGELSSLAKKADGEVSISSVCTVFAESEVISHLAMGESIENVAKGAHVAIAKRVYGMCNRVGYAPKVIMTGGVALNGSILDALGKELGEEVMRAPYPQMVGAIGAAVFAYENWNKKTKKGQE